MNTTNHDNSFVARLRRWTADRGALANLRSGLRSQSALRRRAWPLLAQLGPLAKEDGREDPMLTVRRTVAGLWAANSESHRAGSGNFGVTCYKLRGDHESFDLRFRRLLACDDRDELCERLVPVALAAQAKGITVDYDNLFIDLQYFAEAGRDRVRTRWAQAYWGTPGSEAKLETQTVNAASA